eukprot:gene18644-20525_t
MPSTRRKRIKAEEVEEEDDEQQPLSTKRAKKSSSDEVVWEFMGEGNFWTEFESNINKEINEAFKNRKDKITVMIKTTKFDIIFSNRMVQKNAITGWEKRIRIKNMEDTEKWSWQDEYENWNAYSDEMQVLLRAAKIFGLKQVDFSVKKEQYQVNLIKKEQINKKTRFKRKIKEGQEILPIENGNGDILPPASHSAGNVKREKAVLSKTNGTTRQASSSMKSSVKKEPGETPKKNNENGVKSVVKKGKAPVDFECPVKDTHHVFCEGNDIWDAMLNQTNLKFNNNKFYLMQLLEEDKANKFAVWFRWGRVGNTGATNLIRCGNDLERAKKTFREKFQDKTKNDWESRHDFEKVFGKYDLLKMDYDASSTTAEEDSIDGANDVKVEKKESQLDKRLQALIELICNVQDMEQAVMEMKYDAKKAPLGKLTKEQIKAGYSALKRIDTCITQKNFGSGLIMACDEFYTRIPHVFGMHRPPLIRTKEDVQKKLDLLEALGDIEIALKIISENQDTLLHPIDRHYNALNCNVEVMEHSEDEFKMIEKYVQNTHAATHNTYKMQVQEVYKINRTEEDKNFNDCGNKKLLWHGSRLTNYVSILKQGLRIAPPEAPVTGYMFGKGVYFADISSKSANYCYPSRSKNTGLVMLCEVALGKSKELLAADYDADKLPKEYNSVMGLGRTAPDPSDIYSLPNGTVVPYGKPTDTGVLNSNGYTLNYNEYIVYDTKQIRFKYLVKVKFLFS